LGAALASLAAIELTDYYRQDSRYNGTVHVTALGLSPPAILSEVKKERKEMILS